MKTVFKGCRLREAGEGGGGAPLHYFIAFKRKGIPFFLFKIRLLTEITDKRGKRVFDPMHPT